jgi:hypothetical protein
MRTPLSEIESCEFFTSDDFRLAAAEKGPDEVTEDPTLAYWSPNGRAVEQRGTLPYWRAVLLNAQSAKTLKKARNSQYKTHKTIMISLGLMEDRDSSFNAEDNG